MRFAVISDIHGNFPALRACLEDAGQNNADCYLFVGDYCISNPCPDECIDRIRNIRDKYVVRGNEEKYLENLVGKDQAAWTDEQMQVSYWCYRNVSAGNLHWLLSQPDRIELAYRGRTLHLAHSSSDFIGDCEHGRWSTDQVARRYGDAFIDQDTLQKDIRSDLAADSGFRALLRTLPEGIYIFGHTHVQWSYQTEDGRHIFINPGSCGLPLDCIRDGVPYTILELAEDGRVHVEERRVAFDTDAYLETFCRSGQFENANVWSRVNVRELRARREQMNFFLHFVEEYAQRIGDSRRPFALSTWEQAFAEWEKTL